MTSQAKYVITKLFVNGVLEGLTYTETTTVKFELGKTYKSCLGGSDYKIIEVTAL